MDNPVFIYTLVDPRIKCVFYVGSSYKPDNRLAAHVRESLKSITHIRQTTKECYIYYMMKSGVKPVLSVIEVATTIAQSFEREQHWIETLVLQGHPITNRFDVVAGRQAQLYEKLLKMKRSA